MEKKTTAIGDDILRDEYYLKMLERKLNEAIKEYRPSPILRRVERDNRLERWKGAAREAVCSAVFCVVLFVMVYVFLTAAGK